MRRHALFSLTPPLQLAHVMAVTVSQRIPVGSPTEAGVSSVNSSTTHVATTAPSSSRGLIVMVQFSRRSTFRLSSCVRTSYLQ